MATAAFLLLSCFFMLRACGFAECKHDAVAKHEISCSNVTEKLRYQVSLQIAMHLGSEHSVSDGMKMSHFCSGALIQPSVVLTAARCLDNEYKKRLEEGAVFAVAGITPSVGESKNTFVSPVIAAYRLRRYYGTNTGDIAVLKLKNSASLDNENIAIIPVRETHEVPDEECLASSWGVTGSMEIDNLYQQSSSVQIVPPFDCVRKYNELGIHIFEDNICAGVGELGKSAPCEGGSGDPLVCNGTLTGLVSKGYRRTLASFPGVYTSVFYHNEWIQNVLLKIQSDDFTETDNVVVIKNGSNSNLIRPAFFVICCCVAVILRQFY